MIEESGSKRLWELPPVILHPFNNGTDAGAILASIRLSLSADILHAPDANRVEARERLLQAKYCEFRMLCFIGRDLKRWMSQCTDFVLREALLANTGIREQSFSDLLVKRTPPSVVARFESWGVADYHRILRRAIGVAAVFPYPPDFTLVSTDFLENCGAFGDILFACYQELTSFRALDPEQFRFALYTSSEYISAMEVGLAGHAS
jgi:hypothetical protein